MTDWIQYVAPFASGAFGAGLTAGVAWGVLKAKYEDLERRVAVTEHRLEHQVGNMRCDKMRDECKAAIVSGMSRIETEIINNRNWVTDRFTEIARFMGQHNGG